MLLAVVVLYVDGYNSVPDVLAGESEVMAAVSGHGSVLVVAKMSMTPRTDQ